METTHVMTATEARVHFGELMRRARAGETITITRRGKPVAVAMSYAMYQDLKARKAARDASADAAAVANRHDEGDATT